MQNNKTIKLNFCASLQHISKARSQIKIVFSHVATSTINANIETNQLTIKFKSIRNIIDRMAGQCNDFNLLNF